MRGRMFHVEPLFVGVLLSLAATLQVSLIVSLFGERVFVAWLCGALIAVAEVWQGRVGASDLHVGVGLVLVWAGLGLVLGAFESVFHKRSDGKASV